MLLACNLYEAVFNKMHNAVCSVSVYTYTYTQTYMCMCATWGKAMRQTAKLPQNSMECEVLTTRTTTASLATLSKYKGHSKYLLCT